MQEKRAVQERRSDHSNTQTERKRVSKRTVCTHCGANLTAINLARHQKLRAYMASDH